MRSVTESDLRAVVHRQFSSESNVKVVDEFVIGEVGRIDVAVISDHLQGFELKSDLDTLYRLPRQMGVFGAVFDFCTLVVTPKHLRAAREALKRDWGLAVVEWDDEGGLKYNQVRRAYQRRSRDNILLASLLWRDELLAALDSLELSRGRRRDSRDELAQYLARSVTRDQLREIVTASLTARQGWRADQGPRENVDTSQSRRVSSGFLARRMMKQYR